MRRKINPKYSGLLMSFTISLGMSFFMSAAMTLIHTGLVFDFFKQWLWSWSISFVIAFPTALVIVPLARKLVIKLTG